MGERRFSPALLEAIRRKQYIRNERGLDILVKPIPDDDRPGAMDPRLRAITDPVVKGFRGLLISFISPLILGSRNPQRIAAFMRRYFNDIQSLPVTEGVSVRYDTLQTPEAEVPVRIYRRENPPLGESVPVLLYMHGGGFAAGSPDVVEELVKQLALLSGCVAVQPEYRLAPEHPFPAALNDCWETLKWIYRNAASFGGDPRRICVAGDSAGGNLAAVCAMRDRDEGNAAPHKDTMVKAQVLLYPVLNMTGKEDDNYHFSLDQFTMLKAQKKSILFRINSMRAGSKGVLSCVLGVKDASLPYLSPYFCDLRDMPPTLILSGEFDCLRLDGEAYARKLKAAGIPVRTIRYLGMGHAFAEWIGVQPQAEDSMAEISRFIADFV
jgi:acetyl esterase/lipase